MALRFASINIEGSKHLAPVTDFLKQYQGDVICVQELMLRDREHFERELGMHSVFAPRVIDMRHATPEDPNPMMGIGIFSKKPYTSTRCEYYHGSPDAIRTDAVGKRNPSEDAEALLSITLESDSSLYTIGTTHFMWSPDGAPNDAQRRDLPKFLKVLETFSDLVWCGDTNAPRGGQIWATFASRYHDAIPATYVWSIDRTMHKAGAARLEADAAKIGLEGLMVDALFTTPHYSVSEVTLTPGLSDHMAVTALIEKKSE